LDGAPDTFVVFVKTASPTTWVPSVASALR
jgi:hypothetical protein